MTKSLKKLEIQWLYLNIVKAMYDKPVANIAVNGEKPNGISCEIRMRQACPFSHSYSV
jgi:hypothetical protein